MSSFGCGYRKCVACYPFTYGCEWCGSDFFEPVPIKEKFQCESCGFITDVMSDEISWGDLI